ncbi:patatin-like phospholipase family protein [Methylobacterium gregans]|uniref:patatin-like phospholipase family protein n=1 Tax=Methylobacterium gregans TaxID=374424 RepID=UPI00360864E8
MKPRIALGLQGGGAYGAYGWGVIDRLLEEHIWISAVSGASAGALNGAALVSGLASGSDDGARTALASLWRATADRSPLRAWDWAGSLPPGTTSWMAPWFEPWVNAWLEPWVEQSLTFTRLYGGHVTPYFPDFRAMRAWREAVAASVDFEALTAPRAIPLYVSATDVLTGAARLFTGTKITEDALMASCCLPELFSPVEIDGRRYWDGGYVANPALDPLVFGGHGATDLIVVQLTPFVTDAVGERADEVVKRASDISFNACLMRELKTLTELQSAVRLAASSPRLRPILDINIHLLRAPAELASGSVDKYDTRWSTLCALRDLGRATAEAWLAERGHAIGAASSLTTLDEALTRHEPRSAAAPA